MNRIFKRDVKIDIVANLELFLNILKEMEGKTYSYDEKVGRVIEAVKIKIKNPDETIETRYGFLISELNNGLFRVVLPAKEELEELKLTKSGKKVLKEIENFGKIIKLLNNVMIIDFADDTLRKAMNKKPEIFYVKLLNHIISLAKRRVVFQTEDDYKLFAAYTLLTWIPEMTDTLPYILVVGDKGSGKSRCLEAFSFVVSRTIKSGDMSVASLARLNDRHRVTSLLDEMRFKENLDTSTSNDDNIWSVLRSGIRRGYYYIRYDNGEVKQYEVFGPKIIATNAGIPEDVEERCLRINMYRTKFIPKRIPDQEVEWLIKKLSLIRMLFIANIDILKKLHENIKLMLYKSKLDGRFIETIAPVLVFCDFSKRFVEGQYDYRLSSLQQLSEAGEVFEVIEELLERDLGESFALEEIEKSKITIDEIARWYGARQAGMDLEEYERKSWAKDRRRLTVKIGLILKNKMGLQVKRMTSGDLRFKRVVLLTPSDYLRLKSLYSQISDKIVVPDLPNLFRLCQVRPLYKGGGVFFRPEFLGFLGRFLRIFGVEKIGCPLIYGEKLAHMSQVDTTTAKAAEQLYLEVLNDLDMTIKQIMKEYGIHDEVIQ